MTRRRAILLSALLGAFFLCVYLLSGSADLLGNGDTDLRYQTTQAIVDHGRLWIAHPFYTDTRVAVGRGGHLYAFYAPGQTVLMIPFYVAGKFLAHHLSLDYQTATLYASRSLDLVLGALLPVLFFLLVLRLGYSTSVAVVLTLLFGLGTAAWPDAQSALEQTPVDLFLLLGVIGLVAYLQRMGDDQLAVPVAARGRVRLRLRSPGQLLAAAIHARRSGLVLVGIGAGLAFLTRYDAGIYMPALIAYPLLLRARRHQWREAVADLLVYSLAIAPAIALVGAWDYARFGSPFLTGLHEQTFGLGFWSGLAGLLVSPGKGLIWYVPLVVLVPWGLPAFVRRFPIESGLFGFLALLTLLFYANVTFWPGDPAWGPRYLYVALPYAILPLAELVARWQALARPLKLFGMAFAAVSLLIQVAALSVTQWRFWYQLQAAQQSSTNVAAWTGQPFRWGSTHYHYYWNVRQSPILRQIDNVYQVSRLLLGDHKYRLVNQPDPFVHSNPAVLYPVNTFNFWWADVRHPLLGNHTRWAIALSLAVLALASLTLLLLQAFRPRAPAHRQTSSQSLLPAASG